MRSVPQTILRLPHPRIIGSCSRGATVIEFALVAPLLFLILFAVIEFGLIMFIYSVLEGATSISSRVGRTGYTENGLSREDYIRQKVNTLSGGIIDTNKLNITMLAYSGFDNVGKHDYCISLAPACNPPPGPYGTPGVDFFDYNNDGKYDDYGINGPGTADQVVLYTVSYPWTILTPLMGTVLSSTGFCDPWPKPCIFNIKAVATVKNETFP